MNQPLTSSFPAVRSERSEGKQAFSEGSVKTSIGERRLSRSRHRIRKGGILFRCCVVTIALIFTCQDEFNTQSVCQYGCSSSCPQSFPQPYYGDIWCSCPTSENCTSVATCDRCLWNGLVFCWDYFNSCGNFHIGTFLEPFGCCATGPI